MNCCQGGQSECLCCAVLLRNIGTILSDTPLVFLMWLSVEIQWHGPKHLCIHPNMWTLTCYDRTLSSFDIVFVCGNWFLPEGAKIRSSERSSGAWWQFRVRRKTDSTQTPMSVWREGRRWPHFIYSRSLIYILAATAQFMYRSHLRSAYNNPASLKRKLRIISHTVDIIKCWCLVFRFYIQ